MPSTIFLMSRRDNEGFPKPRDIENLSEGERIMSLLNAEDRCAIAETLSLHGHLFDGGQLDRLGEIFAPEVVYDLTDLGFGTFEGIEAIRRGALQLGERNPIAHHLTNVVITNEERGELTVKSKGLVIRADGTFGSVNHLDTLIRHDGQWRISRRIITAQRAPMNGNHLAHADDR
jgi:SnoaL-like domain